MRHFLKQVLNYNAVEISDVRGRDFKVVNGSYNIEFEFAIGRRLKDACVNLNLFDTGTVQFFEGCDDSRFLAGAGRSVDEEMGEVAALCLLRCENGCGEDELKDFTRALRRSERSWW